MASSSSSTSSSTPYRFRFFRAGAVDQVVLEEGTLANLESLNKKLWLALACPTRGLELDSRSLDLIDTDKDGRIRPPEIIAAAKWAKAVFIDLGTFFKPFPVEELSLDAFSDATDEGRAVKESAHRILKNLGRPEATKIALADVLDTEKIFAQTKLNGDGIVPVTATDDEPTRATLADVLKVMGSVRDRSGEPGVDKEKTDAFFKQVATYTAWLDLANDNVRPLGDATEAAATAMSAVRAKVDDYFMRARLAAYAGQLAPLLDATAEEAGTLTGKDIGFEDAEVTRWPLSHVVAGAPLSLTQKVNPAWAARIEAFARLAVAPLQGEGRDTLTEAEWVAIQKKLTPYIAWAAAKPDLGVGALGAERIRALSKGDAQKAVLELIAADAALAAENGGIESVEKALRLRRDLVPLLRNFVNFADFYGKRCGIFQTGTLYIDGRSCDLCLPVHDVAKHASLAGLAKAYLLYCDCTRKGQDKRTIVAAVTAGDVDNLMVGRNGVFYDRKGDDWDATITRIVENPISVRQAFLSPYKRFLRAIEEQVAKRAAAADAKANDKLGAHATNLAAAPPEKPAPEPEAKKIDIGTVAAIGVAVGGIATFFSSILATFFGLGMWMPLGVIGLLLAISGPSMLIAWLKLRQRNIGPILDANGWAVNAFARMNIPFGAALTSLAKLPDGSIRTLDDPFAEKPTPVRRYVVLAVLVAVSLGWITGRLDWLLPDGAKSEAVFHRTMADAPAPSAAAPAAAAPPHK